MKYLKKSLICFLSLLLLLSVCVTVYGDTIYTIDGYSYVIKENGLASIVGWDNRSDTLVIPNKIGDIYVAEVADNAFKDDVFIKQVDFFQASRLYQLGMFCFAESALEGYLAIPTNVTSIGTGAFEKCTGLTEIVYSSYGGIVTAQCFMGCTDLQTVTLSSFITTIQQYAFSDCPNLNSITIPRSVVSINRAAFADSPNTVIYCYYDSYAHHFAEDNGIEYVLIDAPTPTEPVTEPATEVVTEPATQEPTSATEPSTDPTEPKAPYMLGDADNSGDIDVIDATFVQRYSIEAFIPCEDTIMQADVDSSGDVSSIDATFILRHLIHISVGYPIGEYVS